MLFRTVTLVSQSGTVLMAIYNLRRLQAKTKVQTDGLMSSSMQMIWIRMPAQRKKCKVSQSCDNYDLTISTKKDRGLHQPAPGKPYNEPTSKNWKLLINLVTWEALFPDQCTLMMRSLPELQKPIWKTPCKCLGSKWNQA